MKINWDDIVSDAEMSPRVVLAELLQDADEIEALVIVTQNKDGLTYVTHASASYAMILGMLAVGQNYILREVSESV